MNASGATTASAARSGKSGTSKRKTRQQDKKNKKKSRRMPTPPSGLTERQLTAWFKKQNEKQAVLDNVYKRNRHGETALHRAAIKNDIPFAEELLEHGAPIDAKDNAGWTPLHEACNHGHLQLAELLLKANANVDAKGFEDITPLHDAAMNGHTEVVKLLVKHGADPTLKNKEGSSAIDLAEDEPELKALLVAVSEGRLKEYEASHPDALTIREVETDDDDDDDETTSASDEGDSASDEDAEGELRVASARRAQTPEPPTPKRIGERKSRLLTSPKKTDRRTKPTDTTTAPPQGATVAQKATSTPPTKAPVTHGSDTTATALPGSSTVASAEQTPQARGPPPKTPRPIHLPRRNKATRSLDKQLGSAAHGMNAKAEAQQKRARRVPSSQQVQQQQQRMKKRNAAAAAAGKASMSRDTAKRAAAQSRKQTKIAKTTPVHTDSTDKETKHRQHRALGGRFLEGRVHADGAVSSTSTSGNASPERQQQQREVDEEGPGEWKPRRRSNVRRSPVVTDAMAEEEDDVDDEALDAAPSDDDVDGESVEDVSDRDPSSDDIHVPAAHYASAMFAHSHKQEREEAAASSASKQENVSVFTGFDGLKRLFSRTKDLLKRSILPATGRPVADTTRPVPQYVVDLFPEAADTFLMFNPYSSAAAAAKRSLEDETVMPVGVQADNPDRYLSQAKERNEIRLSYAHEVDAVRETFEREIMRILRAVDAFERGGKLDWTVMSAICWDEGRANRVIDIGATIASTAEKYQESLDHLYIHFSARAVTTADVQGDVVIDEDDETQRTPTYYPAKPTATVALPRYQLA